MTPLMIGLLSFFGFLVVALVILKIYSGTLEMHEDDQLFLNTSESHMAKEQEELRTKIAKVEPMLKVLWIASSAMLVLIIGVWVYQGVSRTMP